MTTRLETEGTWPRIRELAARGKPNYVAVPFVGHEATKRLPLGQGDTLVVRFDKGVFQSGQTDPREIVKYIKSGVDVHAVRSLHAKGYVLGDVALVGSANVSTNSEQHLVEAVIETTNRSVVEECREFIRSLRGDVVELQFAKSRIPLFIKPKGPRRSGSKTRPSVRIQQSTMWAVSLEYDDWDAEDDAAEERVRRTASSRVHDSRLFGLDEFQWDDDGLYDKIEEGHRVVVITVEDSQRMVAPPARVLAIDRYRSRRRAKRMMVCLEVRKELGSKQLKAVLRELGTIGKPLRDLTHKRHLRDPLARALGQLWPTSAA